MVEKLLAISFVSPMEKQLKIRKYPSDDQLQKVSGKALHINITCSVFFSFIWWPNPSCAFQFHDGPIERLTEKAPDVVDAVFQFHDGPIESLVNYSF